MARRFKRFRAGVKSTGWIAEFRKGRKRFRLHARSKAKLDKIMSYFRSKRWRAKKV